MAASSFAPIVTRLHWNTVPSFTVFIPEKRTSFQLEFNVKSSQYFFNFPIIRFWLNYTESGWLMMNTSLMQAEYGRRHSTSSIYIQQLVSIIQFELSSELAFFEEEKRVEYNISHIPFREKDVGCCCHRHHPHLSSTLRSRELLLEYQHEGFSQKSTKFSHNFKSKVPSVLKSFDFPLLLTFESHLCEDISKGMRAHLNPIGNSFSLTCSFDFFSSAKTFHYNYENIV